ncbi:ALG3-domain-containing protein [Ceraceosorus guamensis]|uniref:Dol-P-Man:Man(5)GlcNAc(2)-PP-Dol alpha-1,3-mannosyltransferase n=1 Tax=Ceraceosorus guamensis TaxID=1522189 RepID=A0A316W872_9BASI|nr:ALG3-domain-containing protein [Ceraceosorus guamensis]PWN44243.1 ALG3-domain-containing protein [Ceraceosorus guamensis]
MTLAADAVMTLIIIKRVPYTEIDFTTYLEQAQGMLKGERDYSRLRGASGPCVYPALHLYLHAPLVRLTHAGAKLMPAQALYGALYLLNQALVMSLYRSAGSPSILLPALIVSKRLHSIYVLRMFNDCWTSLLLHASMVFLIRRRWTAATTLWSLALGVKMSVLLTMPALGVILFRGVGMLQSLRLGFLALLVQVLLGLPFILEHPHAYFAGAFDFSRAFLYKWTVHLRFLAIEQFQSAWTSRVLLFAHAGLLLLWITTRWTRVGDEGVSWVLKRWHGPPGSGDPSARFMIFSIFTANLIGMTFARSLHYQFYSWYAQHIPLMCWAAAAKIDFGKKGLPLGIRLALPFLIERSWNIFPSTPSSSAVLWLAHLTLLWGLWRADPTNQAQP